MTTINLRQNTQEEPSRFSVKNGNNGFIFSLGILIVTLTVLAGLRFYVPFAEGKNQALADVVSAENNKLVGLKSLEKVSDMQKRLIEIKSNLQLKEGKVTRLEMTKVLEYLGNDLNAGVVVYDFKYEAGKVTVSFDANDFGDVAKQVLNFKKSNYFTNVNILDISREKNTIICSVEMTIKS